MTTTPFPYTTESSIILTFVKNIEDQIIDQAYEWARDLPEVSLPIELEDEELDQAIGEVTSKFEEVVFRALANRLGIKL